MAWALKTSVNNITDITNLIPFLTSKIKALNIGDDNTIDAPNDDDATTGADSSNPTFCVCHSWDPNSDTTDIDNTQPTNIGKPPINHWSNNWGDSNQGDEGIVVLRDDTKATFNQGDQIP